MSTFKKRTAGGFRDGPKRKKPKFKRQTDYHSSSSEGESDVEGGPKKDLIEIRSGANAVEAELEGEDDVDEDLDDDDDDDNEEIQASTTEGSDEDQDSEASSNQSSNEGIPGKKKKRNDPTAFATSISMILNSKLTTSKRVDPVLSRSKDATKAVKEITEARLETKAKAKLRDEKKAKLENGRVKDVLGLNSTEVSTEDIIEQERKYKKIAQRGVVRMFNAIRAAQVMGEQAAREAHTQGVIGIDKREQKVNEMSKQGFLELIAAGGKK